MVDWDSGPTLADRFRRHAGEATHLYGYAMRAMADDWEAGGPVRTVCAGYEDAPTGSAIQLRLLAAVFRLVLTDRAPRLVRFYPCLGGDDPPDQAWPMMREVISGHQAEVHAALAIPPQTNEVGRSAALLAGLFDLVATSGIRRIRLLELGASAGLNLLVDRYGFSGPGWQFGPEDSPLQLDKAIEGPVGGPPVRTETFELVSRRGCDLSPVDASTPAGRLWLTSFVWPFHVHRHVTLAAALRVAAEYPVLVDRAGAATWLATQLDPAEEAPGVLPVIWNSITELYWPPAETHAVAQSIARYGADHRVARISMEYGTAGDTTFPELTTSLWDPAEPASPRRRRLGTVHHHGIPVRLAP
jgi:hypothetical protein